MNTFNFNFQEMKQWYETNLEREDIFETAPEMHLWKFNKVLNPKNKVGYVENFLLKSIRKIRLFKTLSDKYKALYKSGIYILLDYDPNWVLFVYPSIKVDVNLQKYPYLFADHYSLAFNPDKAANKKQMQFHETIYTPISSTDNLVGLVGATQKFDDHFKNNIVMYKDSYKEELFNTYLAVSNKRESILDMLKFYVTSESYEGGGGSRGITKEKNKISRTTSNKIEVNETDLLNKKWKKYKIEHAFICALKNNNTGKYGVTVTFYDNQIRSDAEAHHGFFFVMDKLNTTFVKNKIIDHIKTSYRQSSGVRNPMSID